MINAWLSAIRRAVIHSDGSPVLVGLPAYLLTLAGVAIIAVIDYATFLRLLPGAPFLVLLFALSWVLGLGPLLFGFLAIQVAVQLISAGMDESQRMARAVGNAMVDAVTIALIWLHHRYRWQTRAMLAEQTQLKQAAETALAQAEQAKEQAEIALAESERATEFRDRLIMHAGHELRTPLTSIIGSAQFALHQIQQGRADLETTARRLQSITQAGLRQTWLVDSLLDASKVHAGRFAIERSETDIVGLAHSAAADTWLRDEHERIVLHGPPEARLNVDAVRIYQVLVNLLSNAVKYGGTDKVEVEVARDAGGVRVCVRDHGPGITAGEEELIFREGEQGAAGINGGLGLGLFISRHIAELHGGTLTAHNHPEGGAVFELWLPAGR